MEFAHTKLTLEGVRWVLHVLTYLLYFFQKYVLYMYMELLPDVL